MRWSCGPMNSFRQQKKRLFWKEEGAAVMAGRSEKKSRRMIFVCVCLLRSTTSSLATTARWDEESKCREEMPHPPSKKRTPAAMKALELSRSCNGEIKQRRFTRLGKSRRRQLVTGQEGVRRKKKIQVMRSLVVSQEEEEREMVEKPATWEKNQWLP